MAFSDSQFLDVLSGILLDEFINKRVKRKLTVILLAWQDQYKDDPDMAPFQKLYSQIKGKTIRLNNDTMMGPVLEQREKEAKREKEKRERAARKREEAEERERMRKEMEKEKSKKVKGEAESRKRAFDFERVRDLRSG